MEEFVHDDPKSISDYPNKASMPQKCKDDAKRRRLAIIEEYARKDGVSLSEQMWALLEKAVDTNWKW